MIGRIKKKIQSIEMSILDARAAVELSRLCLPCYPWTAYALRPTALRNILNEIEVNVRKTIVEFGCGLSTIYIAKLLEHTGGHLISIEEDVEWASLVQGWVDAAGFADQIKIVIAPLEECSLSLDGSHWHDQDIVIKALSGSKIDCLLVDGPKASGVGRGLVRYPALPICMDHLSEECVIYLDDCGRAGEQDVLKKWSELLGLEFQTYTALGGLARGIRGSAYHSVM